MAIAYDNPIPGYNTTTTSNLRLWDAAPISEFDLEAFNSGDYEKVRRLGMWLLSGVRVVCIAA
jgi:glucan phosphorylase